MICPFCSTPIPSEVFRSISSSSVFLRLPPSSSVLFRLVLFFSSFFVFPRLPSVFLRLFPSFRLFVFFRLPPFLSNLFHFALTEKGFQISTYEPGIKNRDKETESKPLDQESIISRPFLSPRLGFNFLLIHCHSIIIFISNNW